MNRMIAVFTLGALGMGIVAAGCAAPPPPPPPSIAPSTNPGTKSSVQSAPGGGTGQRGFSVEDVGNCKTPEGASAENPAACDGDCMWSTESAQCVTKNNGIIVDEKHRNNP